MIYLHSQVNFVQNKEGRRFYDGRAALPREGFVAAAFFRRVFVALGWFFLLIVYRCLTLLLLLLPSSSNVGGGYNVLRRRRDTSWRRKLHTPISLNNHRQLASEPFPKLKLVAVACSGATLFAVSPISDETVFEKVYVSGGWPPKCLCDFLTAAHTIDFIRFCHQIYTGLHTVR